MPTPSMNMLDPVVIAWLALAATVALLGLAVLAYRRVAGRQAGELAVLSGRLEALTSDMAALCSGSMGVDQRLSALERQGRALEQWREQMEARQEQERPYGEAIQLVHKGASAADLVRELGLSHSEAELVVMLHGVDKAS